MAITSQFATLYAPLTAIWSSSGAVPSGYSGAPFAGAGDTPANKIAAINSWAATSGATYAMVQGQKVLNACASADLAALSATQLQQLAIITGATGGVDPTPGDNQATALAAIFSGKTTTLTALGALQTAAKISSSWWAQNGLPWAVTIWDAVVAGVIANPNGASGPATYVYQATNKRRVNLNAAVDIVFSPSADGQTANGPAVWTDSGFGSVSLANSDVQLQALKRIVNVLLPGDAALAALTSN